MTEKYYRHKQFSQVIEKQPKIRPFLKIKKDRRRAIYILSCAGFSHESLELMFHLSRRAITYAVAEGRRKYPNASKYR